MPAASIPHASMYTSIRDTHRFRPARVEGHLPSDLRGTLYRTGPGVFERFGRSVGHSFEADGVVSGVRIDGERNEVHVGVDIVRGRGWHEEEAAGRALYSTAASTWDRLRAAVRGRGKATGNTRMWDLHGDLFALMEGAGPVQIDPDTLETLGEVHFDGVVRGPFSAHPHFVPCRDAWFNFGVRYGRQMEIDLYGFDASGTAKKLTTVTGPYNAMVHDFIATETHLLLLICPAKLQMLKAVLGWGDFTDWFQWSPEDGGEAIVIPIDDPTAVTRHPIPSFWFWHVGNAWSAGNTLHAGLTWYEDLSSLADLGTEVDAEQRAPLPQYQHLKFDPSTGQLDFEPICSEALEFPQIHPYHLGRPQAATFGVTVFENKGHHGIVCVRGNGDTDVWQSAASEQASEPILVPRGKEDDDVWVLSLVHDDACDESYLAVLDGQSVDAGPVAKVWFGQPLPLTFHGTWMSAEE